MKSENNMTMAFGRTLRSSARRCSWSLNVQQSFDNGSFVIPETCAYAITEHTMETDPGLRCQTKIFGTSKGLGAI